MGNVTQDFGAPYPAADYREGPDQAIVDRIVAGMQLEIESALAKANPKTTFQGLPIELDRPKGYVQEGKAQDGTPWRRLYLYDYGFIPGTTGGDQEDLDVFVGAAAEHPTSYWVTQNKPDGTFDEYKVFLGFPSPEHARFAYGMHVPEQFYGGMTAVPVAYMKALLGLHPGELQKRMRKARDLRSLSGMTIATNDYRVRKTGDISLDDMRSLVAAAITAALPPDPSGGTCSSPVWIQDLYDDAAIFQFNGATWSISYAYANGQVALMGDPVQVVRQYVPVGQGGDVTKRESPMNLRKDDKEGAAPPPPPGGGGADIVALASDRLAQIVDGVDAAGGMLTPDLKSGVASVVALLEAVAPDADVPEPDASAEMKEAEKAAEADLTKRFARWDSFIGACAALYKLAKAEKDIAKRATMIARLNKAVTYGQEVFGSATGFTGGDTVTIPEFKDPAQLLPEEVATPAALAAGGQAAYNPGYSGVAPSQRDVADGANAVAKRFDGVRQGLAALLGKGNAPAAAGGAPVQKNGHGWTDSYVAALPDSAFLYVEQGAKKAADGTDVGGAGAGQSKRHFPVYDCEGGLSLPALKSALTAMQAWGAEATLKATVTEKAQGLLKQAEDFAGSALTKGARGDEGWPSDLAAPDFLKSGKVKKASPAFGFDDLTTKVKKGYDNTARPRRDAKPDHHAFDLNRPPPTLPK